MEKLLALTAKGHVRYQLKTPCRDGTTHVIFEPLGFIARLAALVPKPRVNLTCFNGVFAPNGKHRALVSTPAKRGKGVLHAATESREEPTPSERRALMNCAKRVGTRKKVDLSGKRFANPRSAPFGGRATMFRNVHEAKPSRRWALGSTH